MASVQTVEMYVFYFDLSGLVARYLSDGQRALDQLREFQRQARAEFTFSRPHSFVATLYDNVWARINVAQPGTPSLVLDFAGNVMRAATDHGFPQFFGCITRGWHDYDPGDRMVVAKESFEDMTELHLDITSEPHVRAAMAEKWAKPSPPPEGVVWVSSEVVGSESLAALATFPDSAFQPLGDWFDIQAANDGHGRAWPFTQSRFHAIRPKTHAQ